MLGQVLIVTGGQATVRQVMSSVIAYQRLQGILIIAVEYVWYWRDTGVGEGRGRRPEASGQYLWSGDDPINMLFFSIRAHQRWSVSYVTVRKSFNRRRNFIYNLSDMFLYFFKVEAVIPQYWS